MMNTMVRFVVSCVGPSVLGWVLSACSGAGGLPAAEKTALGGADSAGEPPAGGLAGEGSDPGGTSPAKPETLPPEKRTEPPAPVLGGEECILSADCERGTHCDLGVCTQLCNTEVACVTGQYCSPRGRCVDDGRADGDPAPSLEKLGVLEVTPLAVQLTETDDRLLLTLKADTDELVRYRLVPSGAHLSIEQPRGEFEESTVVAVDVDPHGLQGHDSPGTIRVVTSLGETTVEAPIRVGMTGSYEGYLEYFVGDVPLGRAQLVLDVEEDGGDVSVRVDPKTSLVFPSLGTDPEAPDGLLSTYGYGVYTRSKGLEVTLKSLVPESMGGSRNHFRRAIGRELSLQLKPSESTLGVLEGSFSERLFGLFQQPVTVQGRVSLKTRSTPGRHLHCRAPDLVESPQPVSLAMSSEALGVRIASSNLINALAAASSSCSSAPESPSCLSQASDFYHAGLAASFSKALASSAPLPEVSVACEAEMYSDYEAWAGLPKRRCSNVGGLMAVLLRIGNNFSPTSTSGAPLFHQTLARLLAPHLLVAQEKLVEGARESFLTGRGGQQALYEEARELLAAPAAFALQPAILEFLRRTPASEAKGEESSNDSTEVDYPAFRALGRLVSVLSVIEGERASLEAADPASDLQAQRQITQENAVLTVLEAAVLSALVESWGSAPAGTGAELVGALTPLDRGFGTLLHGAVLFGVPEGVIPLAFDPERSQRTNFEQMLSDRAQPNLALQQTYEKEFLDAKTAFDQTQATLQSELESVRAGYDETIFSICGSDFDIDAVAEEGWESCGQTGGSLGLANLEIEQRHAEIQSAFTRLEGMAAKLRIQEAALNRRLAARGKTLRLVDRVGNELVQITKTENVINAAQVVLDLASRASIGNFGAPFAMGVASGVLELSKGELQVRRQELQTLQTMRFTAEANEIDLIDASAAYKTGLIDLHQLEVDMEQSNIALLQASMAAQNLLDTAQRAYEEREKSLGRIEQSPYADPIYRTLVPGSLMAALKYRREAQRVLYQAGRALEYEVNSPLGEALGRAVLGVDNASEAAKLASCFQSIFADHAVSQGVPQEYKTTISVREMLGIKGPRVDEVTGEELDEGELFRRVLLQNENLDGLGGVGLEFSTNLEPGNGLWSVGVCSDKITEVRAQLVGDFLGDNEAEIELSVSGGGVLRDCSGEALVTWNIDGRAPAVIQAGVNSFGTAKASSSLHGQSVARPDWQIFIPGADHAPSNSDLDLSHLDDIVLEVTHKALPISGSSVGVSVNCLSSIGAGG